MTEISTPSTPSSSAGDPSRSRAPHSGFARKRGGEDLTVVLFKDHYVPRTLKVPVAWIPRLGIALSAGGLGLLIAVILAAQGWVLAWRAQPQRLRTLEDQIENLRRSNEALETELRALRRGETTAPLLGMQEGEGVPSAGETAAESTRIDTSKIDAGAADEDSIFGKANNEATPKESQDVFALSKATKSEGPNTAAETKSPTAESATASAAGIPFLLPESIEGGVPALSSLPFRLTPVQTETGDEMLNLKFALQYVSDDGGNQQGRIVVLGRAGDRFAAYPESALSGGTYVQARLSQAPLSPERGEFFSVSRYREVLAQLHLPSDARQGFNEVWILIFSTRGKLLFSQNLNVSAPAKPAVAPSAAPAAKPAGKTSTSAPAVSPDRAKAANPDISR